jgi:biotin carboxyl carrier protein
VDAKALLRETKTARSADELEQLTRGIHPARSGREVPISRLYRQLGLNPYDRPAKFFEVDLHPASIRIPTRQHVGVPANPSVEVGQSVKAGDVLAMLEESKMGCPVHSGIAGKVVAVSDSEITIQN